MQELLQEYSKYVLTLEKSPLQPQTLLPTIISGLQLYFDRSIGANLLYRFERPQYAEVRKMYVTGLHVELGQEKDMSAVYGAEHLLRMIGERLYLFQTAKLTYTPNKTTKVSLPGMVSGSSMDPESVNILKDYVQELMKYVYLFNNQILHAVNDFFSSTHPHT